MLKKQFRIAVWRWFKSRNQNDQRGWLSFVNNLCQWLLQNKLLCNIDKCQIITYTKKKNIINYGLSLSSTVNRVQEVHDLGVTFHYSFLFSSHVHNIEAVSYKNLGYIFCNTQHFARMPFLTIFYSLVRSKLEHRIYIKHLRNTKKPITVNCWITFKFRSLGHARKVQQLTLLHKLIVDY